VERLSDSEDVHVSFDEGSVGTRRSDSEFSVVVVGKGTPPDILLLKGGWDLAERGGFWSLKSIPKMEDAS
jgi:hypothetical protein